MSNPDLPLLPNQSHAELPVRGRMLISKENQRFVEIDADKVARGEFHTKGDSWLVSPVREFILKGINDGGGCLDPFAGHGDLLTHCNKEFCCLVDGFDITGDKWPINDSLRHIPKTKHKIIVTNPPYLAKYSAARKGVMAESLCYFQSCPWEDLYMLALDRCLESCRWVVAIIPETFLNSSYPKKHVTDLCVLEDNPFHDTEVPVCVVCMDREFQDGEKDCRIHLANDFLITTGSLDRLRSTTVSRLKAQFNDPSGNIALKAVDGSSPSDRIRFLRADEFHYSTEKIKVSSRLMTYINIESLEESDLDDLIRLANAELKRLRSESHDLLLSPFKGNNKAGKRRRRLDYALARKILASAMALLTSDEKDFKLF